MECICRSSAAVRRTSTRRPTAYTLADRGRLRSGHWQKFGDSHTSSRRSAGWAAAARPTQSSVAVPYPQQLKSKKLDAQFAKFLEAMSKVHINIPLVEALQQMPNYAKFLKDVVARKRKWGKYETVGLTENCSVIIQKGLPTKHKDLGSFTLSCVFGE